MQKLITTLILLIVVSSLHAQADQPNSFDKGDHNENTPPSFVRQGMVFNPSWAPFFHGVASGDPLSDRVIIWTRITLDSLNTEAVELKWHVATDPELVNIVAEGNITTGPERDYTVKVDVAGLSPGTTYYYGFLYNEIASLTGKTKTAPTENIDHLKFGVVSCSNYQAGYFNAYGHLAARTDLDAIIHLGDYIYEYPNFLYGSDEIWEDRVIQPDVEIVSLEDYRTRFATYRLDSNLARIHQQHPMMAIWDDHESTNNSYQDGASNHQPATEGEWEVRKAAAKKAYFEWMPIREQNNDRVYRSIQYGDLAEIILLDTRLEGREQQLSDIYDPALQAQDRTILGAAQKQWLKDQLQESDAQWKVIAQQVIFSPFNIGWAAIQDPNLTFEDAENVFLDMWNGYPAERTEIINFFDSLSLDDVLILTGDSHSSFAFDVTNEPVDLQFQEVPDIGILPFYNPTLGYDPENGNGSKAVEFTTPSISSANFDESAGLLIALLLQGQINTEISGDSGLSLGNPNPHMKYVNLIQHGYYILDLKPDSATANYYYTPILEVTNTEEFSAAYRTITGGNRLGEGSESAPKVVQDIPAPPHPPMLSSTTDFATSLVQALTLYPNPVERDLFVTIAINESLSLPLEIIDLNGRIMQQFPAIELPAGVQNIRLSINPLPTGSYWLRSSNARSKMAIKFLVK